MPWLTINGISLSGIVSPGDKPSLPRRDIGSVGEAADGSLVPTRIARKRDLKFSTKQLTGADALAWEGLFACESNVWSFDSSFYSSKGVPGVGGIPPPDVQVQGTTKKYGAGALEIATGEDWSADLALVGPWTVAHWAKGTGGGDPWKHYVERSDGAKWVDGVRNDAFDMTQVHEVDIDGTLTLASTSISKFHDDLVASTFLWLDDWAAQVFASGQPFGGAPYLTAAGDLVREAATRQMLLKSYGERVLIANIGGVLHRDARELDLELSGA